MVVITAFVVDRVAKSTGSNLDEIDRKLREALTEKQESKEHHRTILQAAMDGFWLVDTREQILQANDANCRMSGYGAEELLGMKISDLEFTESIAEVQEHMRRIMAQGENRFESRHHRKDGAVFDAESTVQYLMGLKAPPPRSGPGRFLKKLVPPHNFTISVVSSA